MTDNPGTDADRDAIIALIHANRIAIWMRDYDAWAACFVHEPYLVRWGWWSRGGVFMRRGWEEISARLKREFLDDPDPKPDLAHGTRVENLSLRILGDMACADFEQHYPGEGKHAGLVYEFRVFERQDGHWKIAAIGVLDGGSGWGTDAVLQLDADGRVLWASKAAEAALAADDDLVIRNGKLKVRDSRTDARLQAAIKWAAALDSAYMSTQGAVPVMMHAGEGLPTRIWWVIGDGGKIRFTFGDNHVSENRLDVAALVYGLSPAQKQVAALVAEGLSLADIAIRIGTTANTARTHLNRIFEKTGVRTQPALVRVLLSAVAPL